MKIRSRAPLRISFSGGGTDIPPYVDERGGCVLSTTINRYAWVSLDVEAAAPGVLAHSLDLDTEAHWPVGDPLTYDERLPLVTAALRAVRACLPSQYALEMYLHSDTPPGSGLGSSSALVVAILGAFRRWLHLPWSKYDLAQRAFHAERVDMGSKGGLQDQYAAAFGGFNFIEFFGRQDVVVTPLRLPADTLWELEYALLLCYTGNTRRSDSIIENLVENYHRQEQDALAALDQLKDLTRAMKRALLRGCLDDFGSLLHEAWEHKKRTAAQITNARIDALYAEARRQGALGGKLLGAGGGGYLLLYCPQNSRHRVARALEAAGGKVLRLAVEAQGQVAWSTAT